MIWVALGGLIAGGVIGFVICSILTIEVVADREEEIQRLQKQIKYEKLATAIDNIREGEA